MAGSRYNYEVVITTTVKDNTRGGAASSTSSIEKMAQKSSESVTKSSKKSMSALEAMEKRVAESNRKFFAGIEERNRVQANANKAAERMQREYDAGVRRQWDQRQKEFERNQREQTRIAEREVKTRQRADENARKAAEQILKQIEKDFERAEKEKTRAAEREVRNRQRADENARRAAQRILDIQEREFEKSEREKTRIALEEQRRRDGAFARNVNRVERAGNGTRQVGQGIQNVGVSVTAAITVPLVAASAIIVKIGSEYESAMNIFQATTKATAAEMELAGQKAIELGADLSLPATSAADAGDAMTALAKGGFTAQQAIDGAKGVLQLATAAMIDTSSAAEIVANSIHIFGLEAKDSTKIADLFAATSTASGVEITQLAEAMQQSGAVFAQNKIPIQTLVTLIGEMGRAGIKGSDAGTSLKTMLIALTAPTTKAAEQMKTMGVNVYDADHNLRPFRDIVEDMSVSLKGMNQEQQAAALKIIFGTDAMRAASIIFGQGTKAYDEMSVAVNRAGAAEELAAARTKGLAGAWEGLKSQLETLALIIYSKLKGPLTEIVLTMAGAVSAITEWVGAFAEANPQIMIVAASIAALLAGLGPVLVVIGTIVVAVGSLVGGIAAIVSAATAAAAVVGGLAPLLGIVAAAIAGLLVIAGVMVVELSAVALTIYAVWTTNFGGIKTFILEIFHGIQTAWEELSQSFKSGRGSEWITQIKSGLQQLKEFVGPIMQAISDAIKPKLEAIVAWVKKNWPYIKEVIGGILTIVGAVVKYWLDKIKQFWEDNGANIKQTVKAAWKLISDVIDLAITWIGGIIQFGLQVITGHWGEAWETLKATTKAVWKGIWQIIKDVLYLIWSVIKQNVMIVLNFFKNMVQQWWNIGKDIVMGILHGIENAWDTLYSTVIGLIRKLPEGVKKFLGIESPSKVFAEIGRNVAMGFIMGVVSMQGQAQDALQRLVVPPKPEAAGKKTKAIVDADQRNRPGYDYLESIYSEIDNLAPSGEKTKALAAAAELAKAKYDSLAPSIRQAITEAAAFYDQQRAQVDVQNMLNEQLGKAASALLDLKYPSKEGATEVEKFDLMLARLREESPRAAAALDKLASSVDAARSKFHQVDVETQLRKDREAATALGKAVATMADEAEASLTGLADKTDTQLEKTLLQFTRLKDVSVTLAQLNPLKDIAKAVSDLPPEERLNAIATALSRIMAASNGRPAGFSDEQWNQFIANAARAIDASSQSDVTGARNKSAADYDKILEDLNAKLVKNVETTNYARLARELETSAYDNLSRAQKDSLLQRASEVDAMLAQQAAQMKLTETLNKYIDSITQTLTGALDKLLDGDFKGFWSAIKDGFRQLWKSIVLDIASAGIKSALHSIFSGLFGGGGGSGGGGFLGGILGGIFGGKTAKGTTPTTGSGGGSGGGGGTGGVTPTTSRFTGSGGNDFSDFNSLYDSYQNDFVTPRGQTSTSGGGGGSTASSSAGGAIGAAASSGFSLAGLGAAAPMLGLGLGAQLGGNSGLSGVLGGAGGLLLGGALAAALAPGLFGAGVTVANGAVVVSAGASTLGPALAAFLTNPFTIAAGAALLIGAILLNRNKQRRKDETARAQILGDSKSKLTQILSGVNSDQIDGAEALAQAGQVRADYINQVSQLKDSKTRRIALETVRELDAIIGQIQAAVVKQDKRKAFEEKFVPTFASGGSVMSSFAVGSPIYGEGNSSSKFAGKVQGTYDRKDDKIIRVTGNEVVLTPDVWKPIEPYLKKKKVPGFAVGGGTWEDSPTTGSATGSDPASNGPIRITVERIKIDASGIVFEGLKSSDNREVIVETVVKDIRIQREDGILGAIAEVQGHDK